MVKVLLFIADGMADVPIEELNGRTPLEVAQKRALDQVARSGICGLIDVIAPGIPPGSDTAHLTLLGYDVLEVYSGRGALEAIGSGIDILPNDLAFRCNFATIDENCVVLDRRAGRIDDNSAAELSAAIQESLRLDPPEVGGILFQNTIQHRAILRLSGPNLSTMISDTDPHKVGCNMQKAYPLEDSRAAKNTAHVLNTITRQLHEVLKDHPVNEEREKKGLPAANTILFRGVGQLPEIDPLTLLYGIHPAAIAAVPLVRGVCKCAGMHLISVPDATGTYQTNVDAKAEAAVKALETHDFVLVHFKATDLPSHDRDPKMKIEMIEKANAIVEQLLVKTDLEQTFIVVTADHTTSSVKGDHSGEPVPVSITGPNIRSDSVKVFDERNCAKGGLGRIRGIDLMPILLNLLGKAEKAGS